MNKELIITEAEYKILSAYLEDLNRLSRGEESLHPHNFELDDYYYGSNIKYDLQAIAKLFEICDTMDRFYYFAAGELENYICRNNFEEIVNELDALVLNSFRMQLAVRGVWTHGDDELHKKYVKFLNRHNFDYVIDLHPPADEVELFYSKKLSIKILK